MRRPGCLRRLRPRAFIVENVKGLTRSSFANYYQYILLQLTFPEIGKRRGEDWFEHFLRLQAEKASGKRVGTGLTYNVVPTLVNAANYGIPQKRERVFIVGFRADLGAQWSFPKMTHSLEALLYDQWITGAYWERHGVAKKSRPSMPDKFAASVRRLRSTPLPSMHAWRTVRDALVGLPDPESRNAKDFPDHRFQAGARQYPGHTGSPLDLPAKTLKAGDHGVPGGENMLVREDGSTAGDGPPELAELAPAEGKARAKQWERVKASLEKLKIPASRVTHIIESDNPSLVAKLLEELLAKT